MDGEIFYKCIKKTVPKLRAWHARLYDNYRVHSNITRRSIQAWRNFGLNVAFRQTCERYMFKSHESNQLLKAWIVHEVRRGYSGEKTACKKIPRKDSYYKLFYHYGVEWSEKVHCFGYEKHKRVD